MKRLFVATLLALTWSSAASANVPYGTVAEIDDAEILSNGAGLRLRGRFLSWNGSDYDAGYAGTVELGCPSGLEGPCRKQAVEIEEARAAGKCVQLGWDVEPLAVSTGKARWPVVRPLATLPADDPLCVRARAVPATTSVPPPPTVPVYDETPQRTELHYYGGYMFGSDALSLVTSPILVGIGGYFVAPPIIHITQGNYAKAGVSLGLRVALPVLGVAAMCEQHGELTYRCRGDFGGLGIIFGAVGGAVVAMLIDDIALSWSEVPVNKTAWRPSVAVTTSSATVGFGVTF